MLAEDVSRIILPHNVNEVEDLCHNGLAISMVGQCVMSLGEFQVRKGGTNDDRLVVTKHVAHPLIGTPR